MTRNSVCFFRIALSRAHAPNAARLSSMAMPASDAVRPMRPPILRIHIPYSPARRPCAKPQRTIFSASPIRSANDSCGAGLRSSHKRKRAINCVNGSVKQAHRNSSTGISRAMRPISVLKFRARLGNIFMCGWMRPPTNVFAHGFLTIGGQKMSKSRGTFITAQRYLDAGLNPEWLRYYFAAKLNGSMEDIDLNLGDFATRVNSDLIGKYINIASRTAGFLVKRFNGCVLDRAMQHPLLERLRAALPSIATHYENRDTARAMRDAMRNADAVNAYIDAEKPWECARAPESKDRLHEICSVGL